VFWRSGVQNAADLGTATQPRRNLSRELRGWYVSLPPVRIDFLWSASSETCAKEELPKCSRSPTRDADASSARTESPQPCRLPAHRNSVDSDARRISTGSIPQRDLALCGSRRLSARRGDPTERSPTGANPCRGHPRAHGAPFRMHADCNQPGRLRVIVNSLSRPIVS
jgi:hypothetical protein